MEFREVQKFRQLFILLPIFVAAIITTSIFSFGLYKQVIKGIPFGNNPMTNQTLILVSVFTLFLFSCIITLFMKAKLELTIGQLGISFQFIPFHTKKRLLRWDSIDECRIIKYNPIKDFGGWGIKFAGKRILYSVKGNIGLQIKSKDGKLIIIGVSDILRLVEFIKCSGLNIINDTNK